jgi:Mrp family chromosome partitioning ATPase
MTLVDDTDSLVEASPATSAATASRGIAPIRPRVQSRWPWRRSVRQEFAESIRLLGLSLEKLAATRPIRSLVVMSEQGGEGRTTVAANLALAMVDRGRQVVVVDADRRHADLARLLDVPKTSPGIHPVPGITGLLVATAQASALPSIESLSPLTDLTIIDTAPNARSADAFQLAANADGVILVVRRRQQDVAEQRRTYDLLQRLGTPILAVVFNDS